MLVRRGIPTSAYDEGENGAGIQLQFERAYDDGSAFTVIVKPAFEFERADLTVAKHKRWLLEDSSRTDIAFVFEADDALVYDATEPGVGRSCEAMALREVGGKLWHTNITEKSVEFGEKTRRFRLPAGVCLDAVVMVRSITALGR